MCRGLCRLDAQMVMMSAVLSAPPPFVRLSVEEQQTCTTEIIRPASRRGAPAPSVGAGCKIAGQRSDKGERARWCNQRLHVCTCTEVCETQLGA